MSRPLRIEYPGAVYHVTARGNARQPVFESDFDRGKFLELLRETIKQFNWICHAYCLMDNHYHLLIETVDANLSKGMRNLNGVYTQCFNRTHRRVGHVFQGRFKAILVERESYLLELCRYIVLNPEPADYKWSSYRETAGLAKGEDSASTDWILSQFSARKSIAMKRYVAFVEKGIDSKENVWGSLQSQVILGGKDFLLRLKPAIKDKEELKEIPRIQRTVARPTLADIFELNGYYPKQKRNEFIRKACNEHGYSFSAVGRYTGLHYATVSRISRTK